MNLNEQSIKNYARKNPDKQITWSSNIDYFDVCKAIIQPKNRLGRLIKNAILTSDDCKSKTLHYKLWLAFNRHNTNVIPAIFIGDVLVKERINRYNYWCKINSVHNRSLLSYPTMGLYSSSSREQEDMICSGEDSTIEDMMGDPPGYQQEEDELTISDLNTESMVQSPTSSTSTVFNANEFDNSTCISSCSTTMTLSDMLTLSDLEAMSEASRNDDGSLMTIDDESSNSSTTKGIIPLDQYFKNINLSGQGLLQNRNRNAFSCTSTDLTLSDLSHVSNNSLSLVENQQCNKKKKKSKVKIIFNKEKSN